MEKIRVVLDGPIDQQIADLEATAKAMGIVIEDDLDDNNDDDEKNEDDE